MSDTFCIRLNAVMFASFFDRGPDGEPSPFGASILVPGERFPTTLEGDEARAFLEAWRRFENVGDSEGPAIFTWTRGER